MKRIKMIIKYSELLQWLLDRYLIPKDWPNRLEIIKSKKAEVIETLFNSDNEDFQKIKKMFKIFESTPIDSISYNDYQKLYQQLTKTKEAKEKTFFGNYKSPFIYNAYILDYLYQKNNLFLAENSKIIIQNISYEIPNCLKLIEEIKDQIEFQKNKNIKNEKINFNQQINNLKNEINSLKEQLGLEKEKNTKLVLDIDKLKKNEINSLKEQLSEAKEKNTKLVLDIEKLKKNEIK